MRVIGLLCEEERWFSGVTFKHPSVNPQHNEAVPIGWKLPIEVYSDISIFKHVRGDILGAKKRSNFVSELGTGRVKQVNDGYPLIHGNGLGTRPQNEGKHEDADGQWDQAIDASVQLPFRLRRLFPTFTT